MFSSPVHQSQLYASRLLRRTSLDSTRLDGMDTAAREQFYTTGEVQVDTLAERIRRHTGFTIDSSRALDFGCGVGRTTLALAKRCDHVYGLDISPAVLKEADRSAKAMNVENVEWLDAGRLAELDGCFDLVISLFVFQHIPSREGERVFAAILRGLRPGGVGAIQFTTRPTFHGLNRYYLYQLMNSYSLDRLSRLLIAAGIAEWHTAWYPRRMHGSGERVFEEVALIFRKEPSADGAPNGGRRLP